MTQAGIAGSAFANIPSTDPSRASEPRATIAFPACIGLARHHWLKESRSMVAGHENIRTTRARSMANERASMATISPSRASGLHLSGLGAVDI